MLNLLLTLAVAASPQTKPATNTKCPVLGGKVTEKSKTVAVRGQEYRLCCGGCDTTLLKNPDKYLEKDGTPKNAKK
jgi:YHS domain-containing protein